MKRDSIIPKLLPWFESQELRHLRSPKLVSHSVSPLLLNNLRTLTRSTIFYLKMVDFVLVTGVSDCHQI